MSKYRFIGERIKQRRAELDLTQQKLAQKINYGDHTTISKWENGHQPPSIDQLMELCKVLNCEVGFLFGDYDMPKWKPAGFQEATGLSNSSCEMLDNISKYPTIHYFLDDLLSLPPEILEDIAKKYFAHIHVKNVVEPTVKKYEEEIRNKKIDLNIELNGEKISLPNAALYDVGEYTKFELWRSFGAFLKQMEGSVDNGINHRKKK